MNRFVKATLIAACATMPMAAATMNAHGQPAPMGFHGGPGRGGPHGFMDVLAGVQLTDAQKTQVHQIMQTSWQSMRPLMQQLRAIDKQIGDTMASTAAVSSATMAGMLQQKEQIMAQVDAQRLQAAMQIRGLLTPDQLASAAATHQQLEALHAQEHQLVHHDEAPE